MNNDKKETVPLTVLVIEDHPDQRDLLAIVLQREGYKVITAANGLEALEKLETDKVQIALSDIMMPKMDGFELIKRIRGNPALKNIYLILITARIQEGDRVRGLDLGADLHQFDQVGQRLASLKSAMVSCGEALIWTLRCTIAIVDLPALCCRTPRRHDSKSMSPPARWGF